MSQQQSFEQQQVQVHQQQASFEQQQVQVHQQQQQVVQQQVHSTSQQQLVVESSEAVQRNQGDRMFLNLFATHEIISSQSLHINCQLKLELNILNIKIFWVSFLLNFQAWKKI